MKRLALFVFVVASCAVFADTGLRTGNSSSFISVRDLECQRDAGLLCSRDAGTHTGLLRCASASATEPGCVNTTTQAFIGAKTWNGRQRIVGVAHASLTACSSGEKGTWQTCTTHNSPVFCDGTDNHELLGSSSDEEVLAAVYVNGYFPPYWFGGVTLPSTAGWTLNAVSGFLGAGAGTGSLTLTVSDLINTCTCSIDCDSPTGRTACSGSCSWAASSNLLVLRSSSTCTKDPSVAGNLYLMGVAQ
jgi:hypothetical protein